MIQKYLNTRIEIKLIEQEVERNGKKKQSSFDYWW
jgi:hypothetical protein